MSTLEKYIRPLIKSDLSRLVEIEQEMQDFPWQRDSFSQYLSSGCGVELFGAIQAYVFCLIEGECASLLSLAVAKDFQRQGLASCLLEHIIKIL